MPRNDGNTDRRIKRKRRKPQGRKVKGSKRTTNDEYEYQD